MKRTTLKVLAGFGTLLMVLFVLTAAPAFADDGDNRHPSGKDKSTENGNSGTQGNSDSDPDGDSNGGADKPGGTGGTDKDDQDGNNGCGNDDDFEDDNNGNCGKPADTTGQSCPESNGKSEGKGNGKGKGNDKGKSNGNKDCDDPDPEVEGGSIPNEDDKPDKDDEAEEDDVLGDVIGNDDEDPADDEVLGDTLTNDEEVAAAADRDTNGSSLPFTGAAIWTIVALGAILIAFGYLLMHQRSQRN